MNEYVFGWLSSYGLIALFLIVTIVSIGVPFPITLMLIVVGSFVEQGEMEFWQVLIVGTAGAVAGDQIGYSIGRFGGKRIVDKLVRKFNAEEKLENAKKFTRKWGGTGIFFSRWLITLFGPWINITSGAIRYPWGKFIFWDVAGEICWVLLYVMLGKIFSDRVQEVSDLMGNLTWVLVGLFFVAFLGWNLLGFFRQPAESH